MLKIKSWITKDILFPFFLTRIILVASGLIAPYVLPFSPIGGFSVNNFGLIFSNSRIVDMWARWDSGWYMTIINYGYYQPLDLSRTSNLPFFPIFPMIVKILGKIFFVDIGDHEKYIIIGLVVSNVFLISSLIFLHLIARKIMRSKKVAQMVVWAVLMFPTSFFFSAFYSESTFLFLATASYWFALQKKWFLACLSAAFLSATRILGIGIFPLLFFEYLYDKKFLIKKLDLKILWFGLIPIGLISFFSYLYHLTGDFLISIKSQQAWGRTLTNPIITILFPTKYLKFITPIDQLFVFFSLVLSLKLWKEKLSRYKVWAFYSFISLLPPLLTGKLDSISRYIMVIFPLFLYWSYLSQKNQKLFWSINVVFMIIQIIYFGFYSQHYWIG